MCTATSLCGLVAHLCKIGSPFFCRHVPVVVLDHTNRCSHVVSQPINGRPLYQSQRGIGVAQARDAVALIVLVMISFLNRTTKLGNAW